MTCGEYDTTSGTFHWYSNLDRGGRAQSQVSHVDTHAAQGVDYECADNFAGYTAVSAHYNMVDSGIVQNPLPEGSRTFNNILRREVVARATTNSTAKA
jgi:hypothetical protein